MIYHKYETDRGFVINELYDDELITCCGDCEKEIPVTLEDFNHLYEREIDMAGTTLFCNVCSKRRVDAS